MVPSLSFCQVFFLPVKREKCSYLQALTYADFRASRSLSTARAHSGAPQIGCRFQQSGNDRRLEVLHVNSELIEGEGYQQKRATLRNYPSSDLLGKIILVRCDFSASFKEGKPFDEEPIARTVPTIAYLVQSGARVVVASHWLPLSRSDSSIDSQLIASCLSLNLRRKVQVANEAIGNAVREQIKGLENGDLLLLGNLQLYKQEVANGKQFSKALIEKIDILVNEAFSVSHRALASTVGVACFTDAAIAGFEFERELLFIAKALSAPKLPFVAIVGGSKVSSTIGALYSLLEKCSTIVLTGPMAYTFLSVLGYCFPLGLSEKDSVHDALKFLNAASEKKVDVILPVDFLRARDRHETFQVKNISEGCQFACLEVGTMEKIRSALRSSKVALWIGPLSVGDRLAASESLKLVARTFGEISERGCFTIIGGKEAIASVKDEGMSESLSHICWGASALFTMLKGVGLPAVAALDFECPDVPKWENMYTNAHLPLFVDIGSGNGIFNIKMAKRHKDSSNFLGLEVRRKLVQRCLCSVVEQKLQNAHFIAADATTAFKRIVSSYPGHIVCVAIQCPVPEFTKTDNRRRMMRQHLVRAVAQALPKDGKIFLQSDVQAVSEQLKQEFLQHEQDCVAFSNEHYDPSMCDSEGWLVQNPFGVRTDWEDHVLRQGKKMFRVMLCKQ